MLKVWTDVIEKKKEKERHRERLEREKKLFLFTESLIVYMKNKKKKQKLLEVKCSARMQDTKTTKKMNNILNTNNSLENIIEKKKEP